jgi:hypothetical protein
MLEVNVLALAVGSRAAVRAMQACGAEGHIVAGELAPGRRSEAENGTRSVLGVADDYAVTNGDLDAVGFALAPASMRRSPATTRSPSSSAWPPSLMTGNVTEDQPRRRLLR